MVSSWGSVLYSAFDSITDILEYDFAQEKKISYAGLAEAGTDARPLKQKSPGKRPGQCSFGGSGLSHYSCHLGM